MQVTYARDGYKRTEDQAPKRLREEARRCLIAPGRRATLHATELADGSDCGQVWIDAAHLGRPHWTAEVEA